jgi:hypothetical protein
MTLQLVCLIQIELPLSPLPFHSHGDALPISIVKAGRAFDLQAVQYAGVSPRGDKLVHR